MSYTAGNEDEKVDMAIKPRHTIGRPSEGLKTPRRRAPKPQLIDRILDYPYRKLFGLKGQLVIASVIVVVLVIKFITGIYTVTLNPVTCELAWFNSAYKLFHKERILTNTRVELNKLLIEKQTMLRDINDGRNPFHSTSDGNVYRARKINKNKFFWKSHVANLKKQSGAIGKCQNRLRNYRF